MNDQPAKCVLVVEDEPDVQTFIAATLRDAGFEVITASNGHEAYQRIKERIPHAITLDLVMPRQSGVLFYKKIRKNAKWKDVPVLVITAHAQDDLGQEDFQEIMHGVPPPQDYLEKPVSPSTLVARVAKLSGADVAAFLEQNALETRGEIFSMLRNADMETLLQIKDVLGKENK